MLQLRIRKYKVQINANCWMNLTAVRLLCEEQVVYLLGYLSGVGTIEGKAKLS